MLILGIKLKPGVDLERLKSFIDKWVPELQKPTRFGALSSLALSGSSTTDFRQDEFVMVIEGFVEGPLLGPLEELCQIVYNFACEQLDTWPKSA